MKQVSIYSDYFNLYSFYSKKSSKADMTVFDAENIFIALLKKVTSSPRPCICPPIQNFLDFNTCKSWTNFSVRKEFLYNDNPLIHQHAGTECKIMSRHSHSGPENLKIQSPDQKKSWKQINQFHKKLFWPNSIFSNFKNEFMNWEKV